MLDTAGKTVSATPTGTKVMSRNDIVAALKAKVIEDKAALAGTPTTCVCMCVCVMIIILNTIGKGYDD